MYAPKVLLHLIEFDHVRFDDILHSYRRENLTHCKEDISGFSGTFENIIVFNQGSGKAIRHM
jgi:hypothetical protein